MQFISKFLKDIAPKKRYTHENNILYILLEKFVLDCHKWNLGQKELWQMGGCCHVEEGYLAQTLQHENYIWEVEEHVFEEHWLADYCSRVI